MQCVGLPFCSGVEHSSRARCAALGELLRGKDLCVVPLPVRFERFIDLESYNDWDLGLPEGAWPLAGAKYRGSRHSHRL